MFFSSLNLALLCLALFENPVFSTDPNLFLDPLPDEIDSSLSSFSLFPISSSPDSLLGDESVDNLFTDDDDPLLLANCASDTYQQQQMLQRKFRARRRDTADSICPQNGEPLPPVPVPQFPNILNSITGPGPLDGERVKVEDGGVVFSAKTAEFYCGLLTSKPRAYKKPVCGSGNYMDSVRVARAFYSYVMNSRLILTPRSFALCPPEQFFCCLQWLPGIFFQDFNAPYVPGTGTIDPTGLGTGINCESPFDRGWPGLSPQGGGSGGDNSEFGGN